MLRTLILLVVLIVGFAASIYSRFGALLLYLWFAIFRPMEWVWIDIVSWRLSLIIGCTLVIPCLATGVLPRISHPLSIASLLFLGTGLLAMQNAVSPDIAWQWVDFFLRLFLVSFLGIRLTNSRAKLTWVMAVIAVSLSFHSARGGLSYLMEGGTRFGSGLGSGAFADNAHYAVAIVQVLPLLMACAQNVEWRSLRRIFYILIPLSCLTVVGTFERSGFLALLVSVLAYVLLLERRGRALVALALIGVVAAVVVPVPDAYVERMKTIRTYREVEETSALSRIHFWRVAVDMVQAKPLGIGMKNYEVTYDQYDYLEGQYGRERAVHSSHFQVLAEHGYLGFLLWVFLFAYAYLVLFRVRRRSRLLLGPSRLFYFSVANAFITSQTAFLLGGAFLSAAYNDLTWYSFGLISSLDFLQREELAVAAPVAAAA